jgi:hypothetical protein
VAAVSGGGNEMKERPILFSGDMVRAILEGRKTQTRRLIKPQPDYFYNMVMGDPRPIKGLSYGAVKSGNDIQIKCPFGQPGDRLWVRETWCEFPKFEYHYRADWCTERDEEFWQAVSDMKWRPSIHMPREASRILLEIDEIRVERLADITEEDAKAEGLDFRSYLYKDGDDTRYTESNLPVVFGVTFRNSFAGLWDSIYAKQGAGWDANPWVWVVKLHRIDV